MTGQVAIGLVGVLVVSALVYGVGMASSRYKLSDVGAWLTATGKGMIVHANGLLGKVDGKTQIQAAPNHRIKIIQDGNTVLLVNETTGVVSRIDPSQLKVTQSQRFGIGLQIIAAEGVAYTLDPVKGVVQQINPVTLAPIGRATVLTPPIRPGGLDDRGTFWVPTEQTGQLIPFQNGVQGKPVQVAQPGAQLQLSMVAGVPTVIDTTAGQAAIAGPDGVRKVALLSAVRDRPKIPVKVEGQTLPILGRGGALVLLDTGTGRLTSAGLRLPQRHTFGEPQVLGSRIFIPDETAGALIVYNSATGRFEQTIRVSGKPGPIDVFVKDGMLWANDPYGDKAVSVDQNGQRRNIQKYTDKVPGGVRRPIPSQGAGGDRGGNPGGNGDRGGNRPGRPTPPSRPKPNDPPGPPTVEATGDNQTVTVNFGPSWRNRIVPTGYVLLNEKNQTWPKAAPPKAPDSPNGGTFTVSGLECGRPYVFRVAAQYKDPRTQRVRTGRPGQDSTSACKEPAAPKGLVANGNNDGSITVTFQEGDNPAAVKEYILTDSLGNPVQNVQPLGRSGPFEFRPKGLDCAQQYSFHVAARYVQNGTPKTAQSENLVSARPCNPPGKPSNFSASGVNHGANLSWGAASGHDFKYVVEGPNAPGQVAGTSATIGNLPNNQQHTYTLKAVNGAGESEPLNAVADLSYQRQAHQNKANNQTNTLIRPGPSRSGEIGRIERGRYISITVICQVRGESVTESETGETSSWWNRIEWNGGIGYLSVTLMEGPREPGGTMFECA
ncbi:fibronectin type III domain-containing protein [Actinomadura rudentiformis]|uniref:Fibronectin type III domain-containing protein n=1 Tax=Actinomadura rudentiformis TaxID=359158 RepID=A0A6H9YQG2_9ACTN|nr:fibronectin type III domain-containing protein [Actinomadura rudentiformis]KAB2345133.1 fibronectin type III domain-containing protein [Actinomadura rudentiformis]